jgi:lysophospholipase L1-like esterase
MEKQKLLGLAIGSSTFTVCIILIELFLVYFAPVPDPYEKYYQSLNQYIKWERTPNVRLITELEAELPGADGQNTFSTNNMGFRGDYLNAPKPDNEFRVFILGASNAECFYLDDSESIDAVLQDELIAHAPEGLSVKVYNAGLTAANSDDIISMIVHRIVHLEPDILIIFAGDLYAPMRDYDYLHFLEKTDRKKFPLFNFLATEFQIPRRIYYVFKQLSPNEQDIFETIALKSEQMQAIKKMRSFPISDLAPKTNIPGFSQNLRTIIGIAKAHKVQLVFITPQSTWNSEVDPKTKNFHWALYYNGVRYREDLMHKALESYNGAVRTLSVKYSVPLFDLAKILPKSTEYFYDDVHFNVKGAQFAGQHLASFIIKGGLIRR